MDEIIAPLRDAASLILLRRESGKTFILMGLRNAGHKFLPNHMVFPGGGVDKEDFSAAVATPLRPQVLAQLQRAASADLAAALGHAVARELEEETGLSLGRPPALSGLTYLCRAETPQTRPIRFNARFFIADAALATGSLAGSGELEQLDWYELEAILQLDLALATKVVLGQLQTWLALDDSGRAAWPVPVLRDRTWQVE
jgi:8-oxo-dGTP pyrophosphatase MutT (NUDIX family)